MRRILLILVAAAVSVGVILLARQRTEPPNVPFAKAMREPITNTLSTNGKVQPIEWSEAHAESAGAVEKVFVQQGSTVGKGAPLVQLDTRAAQVELETAQARVAQAQAELQTFKQGGRSSDVSTIEGSLSAGRQELAAAQRDYDSLRRLQARNAATAEEVRASKDRVDRAQIQIQGLESRRSSLVNRPDVSAAEGRLREAEAAVSAARVRIGMGTIRSPLAGTVYQFALRAGGYVNTGDLVASIGRLDRVRVLVYVDEPDLGRVAVGKPVTVSWDALPGRQWKGVVDKMPTQVMALGTRQVGEVSSTIENPDHDLLPGTNVNVDIKSQTVDNAVVLPTATIRRDGARIGVYILAKDKLQWRDVKLGVASSARTQVEGVQEGESAALPTDRPLKNDMSVRAVYP